MKTKLKCLGCDCSTIYHCRWNYFLEAENGWVDDIWEDELIPDGEYDIDWEKL